MNSETVLVPAEHRLHLENTDRSHSEKPLEPRRKAEWKQMNSTVCWPGVRTSRILLHW